MNDVETWSGTCTTVSAAMAVRAEMAARTELLEGKRSSSECSSRSTPCARTAADRQTRHCNGCLADNHT